MKFILLAACILGLAVCVPQQMFMEFDMYHAPAQAAEAIPAGVPIESLEVLLPVDAQMQPLGGPVHGFIKQEISLPNGKETKEAFYPFGFDLPDPAVAAPVAPVNPADPEALPGPIVPINPIIAAQAPAAKPSAHDDDDDDD